MERLPIEGAQAPGMQWVCSSAVLETTREASRVLLRRHGLGVQRWHLNGWAAMVADGVACEARWREGVCDRIDAAFTRQLAGTAGPILAITPAGRAEAEALRAFAPPGRVYLSLSGDAARQPEAIVQAAWRLVQAAGDEWVRLSAI